MSVGNAGREGAGAGRIESVISLTVVTWETEKLATEEVMICDVGIWITMAIMYTSWQCIIVAKIGTWSHRSIMATRIRCNILINVKMLCKMIFDREGECKSGWCMQSHEILSHAIKVDGWHFQKNTQTLPLMCVCVVVDWLPSYCWGHAYDLVNCFKLPVNTQYVIVTYTHPGYWFVTQLFYLQWNNEKTNTTN